MVKSFTKLGQVGSNAKTTPRFLDPRILTKIVTSASRPWTSRLICELSPDVHVAKLAFTIRWPWPWTNDLDTQTRPRYDQDVIPYQKWSFYVNSFKSYSLKWHTDTQTDTHTQTDTQTQWKTWPLPHTREVNIKRASEIRQFIIYFLKRSKLCKFRVGLLNCLLCTQYSSCQRLRCLQR